MPTDALPSPLRLRRPVGAAPGRRVSPAGGLPREQSDPGRFYTLLARDSVALVARHTDSTGARSWTSAAARGTSPPRSAPAAPSACWSSRIPAELYSRGAPGRASVLGDGYWLPLADASVDVCFSCNVLEHVRIRPGSSTR